MKIYDCDVMYKATVVERTVVRANDIEEAKQKIRDGDIDDVIDDFTETEEIIDFDFFGETDIGDDE